MRETHADIYHAAAGSKPWCAVLARVAQSIGAHSCQLMGVESATGAVLFSHVSGEALAQAGNDVFSVAHGADLRLDDLLHCSEGTWHYQRELPDNRAAGPALAGNQRPAGMYVRHAASAKLLHRSGEIVLITIRFDLAGAGATDDHRATLEPITAYLREAAAIYQQTRKRVAASFASIGLLNHLPRPALVVTAGRAISFKNTAADQYLGNAKTLFVGPGGLAAYDRKTDIDLASAVYAMASEVDTSGPSRRRVLRVADRNGGRAAAISLRLLGSVGDPSDIDAQRLVLLIVHERVQQTVPDVRLWEATYDLTPAQLRVAREMFLGRSVEEASLALNIAPTTVKSHLKELYWKTGTSRQTQLIVALATLQLLA
jgi:DNA-binding CsgD family transcriptional regulator